MLTTEQEIEIRRRFNQFGILNETNARQILDELTEVQAELITAREVLELIATPKRSDGTYNRSREACEILAKEVLSKIRK